MADVEERFRNLRSQIEEHVIDPEAEFLWVLCDGCGLRVQVDEPKLPEGWVDTPIGDFCGECIRG